MTMKMRAFPNQMPKGIKDRPRKRNVKKVLKSDDLLLHPTAVVVSIVCPYLKSTPLSSILVVNAYPALSFKLVVAIGS